MNLSFDQMLIFATAARERSFSATARRLGKAQSAISTAISNLEIDLGVALFDRSGRYPVLTPAGEALLSETEAILARCQRLKEHADALSGLTESRIVVALEDAFPATALAPVLSRLHADFPSVDLELVQPTHSELPDMVASGEAALGLGCARAHYPPGMVFRRLGHATLVNVAHRDHPLARAGGLRFTQLADHLQLLLPAQMAHLQTREYLNVPRRWHVHSAHALVELIRQGLGWSILPRRLIEAELASGELCELQLEAYPFTDWTVGIDMLWHADTQAGRVSTWLRTTLAHSQIFV
ncbi:MAG: LysR family transcriptional regulator [Rhodocyclaceae bacterium]